MRCPKCGFHSFDYLDSCKKCGNDLSEQKLRFKFQGYVAPVAAATAPEPVEEPAPLPEVAEAENEAIDFGFDVLEEEPLPARTVLGLDGSVPEAAPADFADEDPSAIDLAVESGLNLGEPFAAEDESLPDDGLPKLDDRFDF